MTTDPKDAVGEKLRIAIAEKMGWKQIADGTTGRDFPRGTTVKCKTCNFGFDFRTIEHISCDHVLTTFGDQFEKDGIAVHDFLLPDYPNDTAAALLLVEHMRKDGYVIRLDNGTDTTWEATFYDSAGPETNDSYSPAPTLPMAICLAFSKANQLEIQ